MPVLLSIARLPQLACLSPGHVAAAQAYRSWPKYRHGWDFPGDLEGRGWNENRRVEATDPEPAYFDDESPAALEAQRATIEGELSNFIELLGKSRPHDASC